MSSGAIQKGVPTTDFRWSFYVSESELSHALAQMHREAEVGQLHVSLRIEEDVITLDVCA